MPSHIELTYQDGSKYLKLVSGISEVSDEGLLFYVDGSPNRPKETYEEIKALILTDTQRMNLELYEENQSLKFRIESLEK